MISQALEYDGDHIRVHFDRIDEKVCRPRSRRRSARCCSGTRRITPCGSSGWSWRELERSSPQRRSPHEPHHRLVRARHRGDVDVVTRRGCKAQAQQAQHDVLRHQRRLRQGRRPRRSGRRGRALPAARAGGGRRRQDLARLSEHAGADGARSMRATASARVRGRTPRAWSSPRTSPSCTAQNNLTKQTALTEKGESINGRGDTPNTHDILTGSQPDGTAFAGRRGPHLRQLDQERRRARRWSAITTAGAQRRRRLRSRGTRRIPRAGRTAAAARTI